MPAGALPTLGDREPSTMDTPVFHELPAYVESAEASDAAFEAGEGSRLGALLVLASPFALTAWVAIGVTVYRLVA
jgi:hypothetical protein